MQNNFEAPKAALGDGPELNNPDRFSWRAAFLGAAVGIAGPAYSGTLLSAVTLQISLAQGMSAQQAYALLGQSSLSLPAVISVLANTCFALTSGWVSAAYGRGTPVLQGVATALLAATFPILMFLNSSSAEMSGLSLVTHFGIPVLGSIVGAYLYSRKARPLG
jgi:hypothetical protein